MTMNLSLLDNPGWHALNSHHQHLAIRGKIAARYPPDVLMGVAMPKYDQAGFEDLATIVSPGEIVAIIVESPMPPIHGWQIVQQEPLPQMVCRRLNPATHVDALKLTAADVPDMLALIAIAQPGPFLQRTIELGSYIGLRREGRLIAMAGERIHLPGFCEISAVCTHPDFRGRGYGGALTTLVAQSILARGETPFLHHAPGNENAARLYRKLGFRQRARLTLAIITSASDSGP